MSLGDGPFSAAGIGVAPMGPVERVNSLLGIANTPDMWSLINKEEIMRNMMQATQNGLAAAQQASMVHRFPAPPVPNQPANPARPRAARPRNVP